MTNLIAEFASADICHLHLTQIAVSTKLAVAMPGVGNSQAKHIQALCT